MSISKPSNSPKQSVASDAHPPELDLYVDHFLSTMCDRSRRQILEMLAIPDGETQATIIEQRSGDIARALGLSPATVSGHLRQLSDAGLISSRRDGNVIYYRLRNYFLVRAFQDFLLALHKEHSSVEEEGYKGKETGQAL